MPVSDTVLIAVTRNAFRHLVEADDHFKNQRYASALASAVFSIEESGKLGFLQATGKNQKSHRIKQIPYALMLHVAHNFGWMLQWQRILKEGLNPITPLTEQQEKFIAAHPEFFEFIRRLRDGEFTNSKDRTEAFATALWAKEKRDGTSDRFAPLYSGELHNLRMQATYVDIDEAGEIASDPSLVVAEEAESKCGGALVLLALSIAIFLPVHLKEDFSKRIPDNFTGERLVQELVSALKIGEV